MQDACVSGNRQNLTAGSEFMGVESILGQAELNAASKQSQNKVQNDKEMFLKLLVAQLSHQDPLNPVEDKEFVAQLAQFTQLEELQKINEGVESVVKVSEKAQFNNAVSLMGTTVVAEGGVLIKGKMEVPKYDKDGKVVVDSDNKPVMETKVGASDVYYRSDYDTASTTVTIVDAAGKIVYSAGLGPSVGGVTNKFTWDGRDPNGNEVKDGAYSISFTGSDQDGKGRLFTTEIAGTVYAVESVDGKYMLHLTDGRTVNYATVGMVGISKT